MAIELHKEQILSLTEAAKSLPRLNGRRPAISTLWRWARKGVRGVRLDYIRVGRGIATSAEALQRFFNALAEADAREQPAIRASATVAALPNRVRRQQQAAVDELLRKAGF